MKKLMVVLVVGGLLAGVLAAAGCGTSEDTAENQKAGARTPEQVVDAFMDASTADDTDAAALLVCSSSLARMSKDEMVMEGGKELGDYRAGAASISGNKAVVPVRVRTVP